MEIDLRKKQRSWHLLCAQCNFDFRQFATLQQEQVERREQTLDARIDRGTDSSVVVQGGLLLGLDIVDSLHEVFVLEDGAASAQRGHAGLDADGLHLGSVELGGAAGQLLEVHIVLIHVHFARVDLHDARTGLLVRQRKLNFTIETTGAEEGRVENVRSVRRSNNLDVIVLREAIELVK